MVVVIVRILACLLALALAVPWQAEARPNRDRGARVEGKREARDRCEGCADTMGCMTL